MAKKIVRNSIALLNDHSHAAYGSWHRRKAPQAVEKWFHKPGYDEAKGNKASTQARPYAQAGQTEVWGSQKMGYF